LNEYYASFENIGHNTAGRVVLLWIVPNGLWIVFSLYMTYVLAKEITSALNVAKTSDLFKED
jgi:hypothetical protein